MSRTRVTVILDDIMRNDDVEFSRMSEWVHEEGYNADQSGCLLDWFDGTQSFFPWSVVRRVDFNRCDCVDCRKAEA